MGRGRLESQFLVHEKLAMGWITKQTISMRAACTGNMAETTDSCGVVRHVIHAHDHGGQYRDDVVYGLRIDSPDTNEHYWIETRSPSVMTADGGGKALVVWANSIIDEMIDCNAPNSNNFELSGINHLLHYTPTINVFGQEGTMPIPVNGVMVVDLDRLGLIIQVASASNDSIGTTLTVETSFAIPGSEFDYGRRGTLVDEQLMCNSSTVASDSKSVSLRDGKFRLFHIDVDHPRDVIVTADFCKFDIYLYESYPLQLELNPSQGPLPQATWKSKCPTECVIDPLAPNCQPIGSSKHVLAYGISSVGQVYDEFSPSNYVLVAPRSASLQNNAVLEGNISIGCSNINMCREDHYMGSDGHCISCPNGEVSPPLSIGPSRCHEPFCKTVTFRSANLFIRYNPEVYGIYHEIATSGRGLPIFRRGDGEYFLYGNVTTFLEDHSSEVKFRRSGFWSIVRREEFGTDGVVFNLAPKESEVYAMEHPTLIDSEFFEILCGEHDYSGASFKYWSYVWWSLSIGLTLMWLVQCCRRRLRRRRRRIANKK